MRQIGFQVASITSRHSLSECRLFCIITLCPLFIRLPENLVRYGFILMLHCLTLTINNKTAASPESRLAAILCHAKLRSGRSRFIGIGGRFSCRRCRFRGSRLLLLRSSLTVSSRSTGSLTVAYCDFLRNLLINTITDATDVFNVFRRFKRAVGCAVFNDSSCFRRADAIQSL